jgi:hypothetical protein
MQFAVPRMAAWLILIGIGKSRMEIRVDNGTAGRVVRVKEPVR